MTWVAANPELMAIRPCRIQTVGVPHLPTELDESMLAALDRIGAQDPKAREYLLVLATDRGAHQLQQTARMAEIAGPRAVARIAGNLARDGQLRALRWQD